MITTTFPLAFVGKAIGLVGVRNPIDVTFGSLRLVGVCHEETQNGSAEELASGAGYRRFVNIVDNVPFVPNVLNVLYLY